MCSFLKKCPLSGCDIKMLVYWSSFLVLWTILELSIEFYMYFHKLSRPTPPHQVVNRTLGFDMMHGWVFLLVAFRISERKPNLSPEQLREQQARGKKGCQMASRLSECYQQACLNALIQRKSNKFVMF